MERALFKQSFCGQNYHNANIEIMSLRHSECRILFNILSREDKSYVLLLLEQDSASIIIFITKMLNSDKISLLGK